VRGAARLLVLLFAGSLVAFALARAAPGDPVLLALLEANQSADPDALAALRTRFGLDRQLPAQYLLWLSAVLLGDLGTSIRTGEPVARELLHRLLTSLLLASLGLSRGRGDDRDRPERRRAASPSVADDAACVRLRRLESAHGRSERGTIFRDFPYFRVSRPPYERESLSLM